MGVSLLWKTEYLDGCSTAMRCVARKVSLYVLKVTPPWRCSFQMSELAYDSISPLGLSLQSPIGFI